MTAAAWAGPSLESMVQLSCGPFDASLGGSGGSLRVETTGKHTHPRIPWRPERRDQRGMWGPLGEGTDFIGAWISPSLIILG